MPTKTIKEIASEALKHGRDRSDPIRGQEVQRVTEAGGDNDAGLIEGFSVITRGEALGHRMWVDAFFVNQVNEAMAGLANGTKARFTHPGLSSDGLGTFLGRAKDARLADDGDRVVADLHISQTAHNTPDGNLAAYVMDLANEDPEAFGTSIVFMHDPDAEAEFEEEHSTDEKVEGRRRRVFRSPDERNTKNFFHARLKELRAVDVVDSPAANPSGMFCRQKEVLSEADGLLSFAFGLEGSERPKESCFDVDPDRLAAYLTRFLDSHDLSINKKDSEMAEDKKPVETGDGKEKISDELNEDPSTSEFDGSTDAPVDSDVQLSEREIEQKRTSDIAALCKQAGCPEKLSDFAATNLSPADIQTRLFSQVCTDRAFDSVPSTHDASPTKTKSDEPTKEDQWAAEWESDRVFYDDQGISKEQFINNKRQYAAA